MRTTRHLCYVVAVTLTLGCGQDDLSVAPGLGTPQAQIVDGANNGGNAHFYFLSPIVRPSPNPTGTLDASLLPHLAVRICTLDADGECGSVVTTFTSAGQGPAKLRIENDEQPHFHVNWQTRAYQLDPAADYRIAVLAAGTELGYAEVDGALNGQTLPIKFLVLQGGVFVIGTAGGTISAFGDAVTLAIPGNALSANTGITIEPATGLPTDGAAFVLGGSAYDFGPDGLTFDPPALLTMAYDEATLPPERKEHELALLHLVDGKWEGVGGITVNAAANVVTGPITSFSPYAVGGGAVIQLAGLGTATIDGTIGTAEWAGADCRTFPANLPSGDTTTTYLCVMNDATNLYLSVRFAQSAAATGDGVAFVFDNLDDGDNTGDDWIETQFGIHPVLGPGASFLDMFLELDPPCPANAICSTMDEAPGGTTDGAGALGNAAGFSSYEMAHPLNTAEDAHDFSLASGNTVGFVAVLALSGSSGPVNTWFPSPADHGHIVIQSTAPAGPGSVSAGYRQSCALTTTGGGRCWGANAFGGLGDNFGSTLPQDTPVTVAGGFQFQSISVGAADASAGFLGAHACGVAVGGAAYCWGLNTHGQLGNGSQVNPNPAPVAVSGNLAVATISAGESFTCGVITSGAAYCWGNNGFGQVGDGTLGNVRTTPVAVSGNLAVASISAGGKHTCAVTTAGDLYCWGANGSGQLGIGSQGASHTTPQLVGASYASVSAGSWHTCAVKTNGDAYCWGGNAYGNVGDGTAANVRTSPVLVSGGLTFASVDAGSLTDPGLSAGGHTCGVTTSGAAYCWGLGLAGELGNGANANASSPVAVSGGLSFRAVSAGERHACGVTTSGAVYCWGGNGVGQLGTGDKTSSNVPVAIYNPGGVIFASIRASRQTSITR